MGVASRRLRNFHLQRGAHVHVYLLMAMAAGTGCKEETRALLGIWGVAYVQSQLDGVVRNKTIYDCKY